MKSPRPPRARNKPAIPGCGTLRWIHTPCDCPLTTQPRPTTGHSANLDLASINDEGLNNPLVAHYGYLKGRARETSPIRILKLKLGLQNADDRLSGNAYFYGNIWTTSQPQGKGKTGAHQPSMPSGRFITILKSAAPPGH